MCSYRLLSISVILLAIGFIAFGCGSSPSGGVSPPTPTPVLSPEIVNVSPSDESTNVPLNTSIQILFSKDMDDSTIDTTTIQVENEQGSAKNGTVSYDPDARTALFVPSSNFSPNTIYWIRISGSIKDAQGYSIGLDEDYKFTTGNASDTTPPHVTDTRPLQNATAVAYDTNIYITFDEPIVYASATFEVYKKEGSLQLSGQRADLPELNRIMFTPEAELEFWTTYEVKVAATDLMGNRMASLFTLRFRSKGWTTDVVEPSGRYPAVAIGADDALHISYDEQDGVYHSLQYRKKPYQSSWGAAETIDESQSAYIYRSGIAIGPDEQVHMSYQKEGLLGTYFRYAYKETAWLTKEAPVLTGIIISHYGSSNSLALDSSNNPYMAIYKKVESDKAHIEFVERTGGFIFEDTEVDQVGDENRGQSADIVVAGSTLYIAYRDVTNDRLKLAYKGISGSSWSTVNLGAVSGIGSYCAIAKDNGNNIYVLFYDSSEERLKVIKQPSATVVAATIDSNIKSADHNDIYVDSHNIIHVSYYDSGAGELKYASQEASKLTQAWHVIGVASVEVGNTSIVADSFSKPHLFYYDRTENDVGYAHLE